MGDCLFFLAERWLFRMLKQRGEDGGSWFEEC